MTAHSEPWDRYLHVQRWASEARQSYPSAQPMLRPVLSAVTKARRQPVDRQVYRALRPYVGRACTIAPQQLDLQMVERIEIRKAVADAARERRIVVEQRRLLRDREEVRNRARMLVADASEDRVTDRFIGNELGISRRDGEIGLGEHNAHVRHRRA